MLFTGGFWSTYWYNGRIYGAEIARGIDVFRLTPSEHLSASEIAAAELVRVEQFNAQLQPRFTWPAAAPVARAYLDQMVRAGRILTTRAAEIDALLGRVARGGVPAAELRQAAARLDADAAAVRAGTIGGDAERLARIAEVLRGIAP
jgi:hypothetical protein